MGVLKMAAAMGIIAVTTLFILPASLRMVRSVDLLSETNSSNLQTPASVPKRSLQRLHQRPPEDSSCAQPRPSIIPESIQCGNYVVETLD